MSIPNENKLKKLEQLLLLANDGLNKADFDEAFKKVIEQVLKVEVKALEKINKATEDLKAFIESKNKDYNADFRASIKKLEEYTTKAEKEQRNALNYLIDKADKIKNFSNGKDGKDGKDADEEKIITEVLNKIEIPEKNIGIDDVSNLRDELKEIRKIKGKGGGGGASAIAIANAAKYFVKTEALVGDVDGVNVTYSVSKVIFAVLALVVNGEYVARLPNYTITNNKIIFSTALDSAYNGKDIEIVYI